MSFVYFFRFQLTDSRKVFLFRSTGVFLPADGRLKTMKDQTAAAFLPELVNFIKQFLVPRINKVSSFLHLHWSSFAFRAPETSNKTANSPFDCFLMEKWLFVWDFIYRCARSLDLPFVLTIAEQNFLHLNYDQSSERASAKPLKWTEALFMLSWRKEPWAFVLSAFSRDSASRSSITHESFINSRGRRSKLSILQTKFFSLFS